MTKVRFKYIQNISKWYMWNEMLMNPQGGRKNPSPRWDLNPRPSDSFKCSNHWATGDSVAKGEMWIFDSSSNTQLQSQITLTDSIAHNYITQSPLRKWLPTFTWNCDSISPRLNLTPFSQERNTVRCHSCALTFHGPSTRLGTTFGVSLCLADYLRQLFSSYPSCRSWTICS